MLMLVIVTAAIVQIGVTLAYPFRNETLLGPVVHCAIIVLFGYMAGAIVWRTIRQIYWSRRWLQHFKARKHNKLTKRMQYIYRSWGTEIMVVQDDAFVALTIGLFRPKIIVSTMVIDSFSEQEVKAILLHERYHCLNRDGRKMFLSSLLIDAFGYLPIVKPIVRYYETWKELFADRYAIEQMGTELYLGSILLKLAKREHLERCKTAVYFANSTLHYRVMQVLEPDKAVKVPLALWKPFLKSCSILLLLIVGGDS
jgi:Zn-dependent protease with chaperone function